MSDVEAGTKETSMRFYCAAGCGWPALARFVSRRKKALWYGGEIWGGL